MIKNKMLILVAIFLSCSAYAQQKDSVVCPKIVIDFPAGKKVTEGKHAIFALQPFKKPLRMSDYTFDWMSGNGTILSGQNTMEIHVDTRDLKGHQLNVTVLVSGLPVGCPDTAYTTIDVVSGE